MGLSPEALKAASPALVEICRSMAKDLFEHATGRRPQDGEVGAMAMYLYRCCTTGALNEAYLAASYPSPPAIADLVVWLRAMVRHTPDGKAWDADGRFLEAADALTAYARQVEELTLERDDAHGLAAHQATLQRKAEAEVATLESQLERAREALRQILRCEYDGVGLRDCTDNTGAPYQSQDLANRIAEAEAFLKEIE